MMSSAHVSLRIESIRPAVLRLNAASLMSPGRMSLTRCALMMQNASRVGLPVLSSTWRCIGTSATMGPKSPATVSKPSCNSFSPRMAIRHTPMPMSPPVNRPRAGV